MPTLGLMEPVGVTVGTSYEAGVFTLGFSDQDSLGVLLFQKSDTIDEQGSLLGLDTYSISTDAGATIYGGVESASLSGTDIELHLTTEAVAMLGVPGKLLLRVEDEDAADVALNGLRRMGSLRPACSGRSVDWGSVPECP